MAKINALGLCGSLRADAYNLKLLRNFLAQLAAGDIFAPSEFGSLEMPLVNQDLEASPLPPRVLELHAALAAAPVVVVASPEYNGSLSGALKNAIDWGTRPAGTNLWGGKVVVLLSASPGALGGVRGLIHVRAILSGLKAWVIPEQVQCPAAHQAFAADGHLQVEFVRKQLTDSVKSLEFIAKKLLV